MSAKLSDVEKFVLIDDKITKFILREDHVDNKGRCKFFWNSVLPPRSLKFWLVRSLLIGLPPGMSDTSAGE